MPPGVSKRKHLENLLNEIKTIAKPSNVDLVLDIVTWTKEKIALAEAADVKKKAAIEAKSKKQPAIIPLLVSRGEIWEAKIGVNIGSEQSETRPVLIIQNDGNNKRSPNTIIAPITKVENRFKLKDPLSAKNIEFIKSKLRETEVLIVADSSKSNPLDYSSILYLQNIKELSKERLTFPIGKLNETMWEEVNTAIKFSLGL